MAVPLTWKTVIRCLLSHYCLLGAVTRMDAGEEPTWMYLRRAEVTSTGSISGTTLAAQQPASIQHIRQQSSMLTGQQ